MHFFKKISAFSSFTATEAMTMGFSGWCARINNRIYPTHKGIQTHPFSQERLFETLSKPAWRHTELSLKRIAKMLHRRIPQLKCNLAHSLLVF
jgi:hypothetical protein